MTTDSRQPTTDELQRNIALQLRRMLTIVQRAQDAYAAPCPACAALMPTSYHYCDACGAQLRGAP